MAAVLSGNRNFEGRIHPEVRANYLVSPPLVVAYALAGRIDIDLDNGAARHGHGRQAGLPEGHLADATTRSPRPSTAAVQAGACSGRATRRSSRATSAGASLDVPEGETFAWDAQIRPTSSTRRTSRACRRRRAPSATSRARACWRVLGDSITTDHISPAGSIKKDGPAGKYLIEHGVEPKDFNSYGSRRGNHEVMVRGTFANIRLKNLLAPGHRGRRARATCPTAQRCRSSTRR